MAKSSAGCPICGKKVETEFKPFCSRRCADVDLNRWLGGQYSIPASDQSGTNLEPVNDNQDKD